jgi:hypothetical protein
MSIAQIQGMNLYLASALRFDDGFPTALLDSCEAIDDSVEVSRKEKSLLLEEGSFDTKEIGMYRPGALLRISVKEVSKPDLNGFEGTSDVITKETVGRRISDVSGAVSLGRRISDVSTAASIGRRISDVSTACSLDFDMFASLGSDPEEFESDVQYGVGSRRSTTNMPLPSVGSANHGIGSCSPCGFIHKGGCTIGIECTFCHLCLPGSIELKRKLIKKEKKRSFKALKQASQVFS